VYFKVNRNAFSPAALASIRRKMVSIMIDTAMRGETMSETAKIFMTGRSQAVRLPAAYRFNTAEVSIRRDPQTGDVILSARPTDWHEAFSAIRHSRGAELFPAGRDQDEQTRDPFSGF
jgi:antitoxin VapB